MNAEQSRQRVSHYPDHIGESKIIVSEDGCVRLPFRWRKELNIASKFLSSAAISHRPCAELSADGGDGFSHASTRFLPARRT